MSQLNDLEALKRRSVLTSQIITFALIAGMVMFAINAFVIAAKRQPGDPLIAYIAAGFAGLTLVVQAFWPSQLVATGRKAVLKAIAEQGRPDRGATESRLIPLFQTKLIVRGALLEAAGFFCLVAYLISGLRWLFAIVAVLIALMAMTLPTRSALDNWLEQQLQLLELST